MAVYPYECIFDDKVECQRGTVTANFVMELVFLCFAFIAILLVAGFMIGIIIFQFITIHLPLDDRSTNSGQRSLKFVVAKQALMYLSAFLLSWGLIPLTFFFPQNLTLQKISFVIFPLQGFFNAIIFFYHKVFNIKMQHGENEVSTKKALYYIFFKPDNVYEIELKGISKVERDRNGEDSSMAEEHGDFPVSPANHVENEDCPSNVENIDWSKNLLLRKCDAHELSMSLEFSKLFDARQNHDSVAAYSVNSAHYGSNVQSAGSQRDVDSNFTFNKETMSKNEFSSCPKNDCSHDASSLLLSEESPDISGGLESTR